MQESRYRRPFGQEIPELGNSLPVRRPTVRNAAEPFGSPKLNNMKTYTRLALILVATLPVALFASTDSKIEDAAKASYNYHTVLEGRVHVKSNDGVVTLSGTVLDRDDKALAEDTVENLPGVVRVNNEIEIKSDVAEHSDGWIALKVRGQLLVKANVSATSTKVDVKDGIVTLTGTAINIAQKDLTGIYAKEIDNVKSVRNEIVVVAPAPGTSTSTAGEIVDDASITSQVKYSLLSHRATSALSTKVVTENAVVNISGVADSDAEKALVTKLAQDTRGVKSVVNDMTVRG